MRGLAALALGLGPLACGRPVAEAPRVAPASLASSAAVAEAEPLVAVRIAVGHAHACALGPAGEVMCWGLGGVHRLGKELPDEPSPPVRVALPGPATALATTYHSTCAVVGGKVLCWGQIQWLTRPLDLAASGPVALPGVEDATEVVARAGRVCAVRPGGVACWDQWNTERPLLLPFWGGASVHPGPVVFAGRGLCALTEEGKLQCWSEPCTVFVDGQSHCEGGEVGEVPALGGATRVSFAERGGCAVEGKGAVRCWGANAPGGDPLSLPTRVEGIDDAVEVQAADAFSCAARRNGEVLCWGLDQGGEMGKAGRRGLNPAPIVVEGAGEVVRLAAGEQEGAVCGIGRTGEVRCWGMEVARKPVFLRKALVVPEIKGAISVATAAEGTCALLPGDQVRCWGDSFMPFERRWRGRGEPVPTVSFPAPGAEAVLFIRNKLCSRVVDGAVSCWSFDHNGPPVSESFAIPNVLSEEDGILSLKLDDGEPGDRGKRKEVAQASHHAGYELSSINAQESQLGNHSCAVRLDGRTHCWMHQENPVQGREIAIPRGATRVELGEGLGCALGADQQVRCFWLEKPADFLAFVEKKSGRGVVRIPQPPLEGWPVEGWSEVTDLRRTSEGMCALRAGEVECFDSRWVLIVSRSVPALDRERTAPPPPALLPPPAPRSLPGSKDRFPRWKVEGIVAATSMSLAESGGGCALLGEGRVACWGNNLGGRLGVEDLASSSLLPTPVPWPK